jgi:integrase/recombinase XerD
MKDAVTAFREYLTIEKGRRPRTVAAYLPVIEGLLEFLPVDEHGEAPQLAALRRADLSRYLQDLARSSATLSKGQWNNRLAALRAFFHYLFMQEVIDVNPASRIERQKIKGPDRIPLTLEEMVALVTAIEKHSPKAVRTRNVAVVQVLIHCGLRVHELAGLRLDQVDLAGRHLLNVRTKGGKKLSAPMNDVVAEAVEKYLLADRDRLLFPDEMPELFATRDGTPLSTRGVQQLVREYAKKAGIKRQVTPHILRHSSATELVEDLGFDIRIAQGFLGHESVKTTEIYVHANRRRPRKAMEALAVAWKQQVAALPA